MVQAPSRQALTSGARKKRRSINIAGYSFIAPWLIGFICFTSVPMFYSLYLSFCEYDILSAPTYVGLKNFQEMFSDNIFWTSLGVTFKYVFILVPFRLAAALGVAIVLAKKHRGIGIYRTAYYIPSLLGGSVAISIIWQYMFRSNGAVNGIISAITGKPFVFNWVGEPSTALYSLMLLGCWHFGSAMLIFVSGIKQIPVSYYEAADMDGANAWQKFLKITLPSLSPVIFFNLVQGIINAFKNFTEALVITDGGPMNSTMLFSLYIYKNGFKYFKMGYAASMSWVLLLIIAFFSIFVFSSSESWVHYES